MEKHLLTCETCGGVLNYAADGKSAVCPFCGNEYYFKEEKSEALEEIEKSGSDDDIIDVLLFIVRVRLFVYC